VKLAIVCLKLALVILDFHFVLSFLDFRFARSLCAFRLPLDPANVACYLRLHRVGACNRLAIGACSRSLQLVLRAWHGSLLKETEI
jgi:hypothetical protein